jgi:Ca2+-binding RTX toxin-like protein
MSTISLVAKEAHFLGYGTGKSHCYLVYENDAGQRFVTSLTDVSEEFFPFFRLRFNVEQINTPYAQAQEIHDLNRAERQLDLGGRDVDAVWSLINQHAQEIKVEKPTYDPLTQNSTSFIASLLNIVGLDFVANLPGFNGNHPTDNPQPGDYPGLNNLLDFDYRLVGTASADIIRGAAGNDVFWGGGGDDALTGKEGSDVLDGGSGTDAAGYFGPRPFYGIAWIGGATVFSTLEGTDRLYNIEGIQFADRTEHITDESLEYIASNPYLMAAFCTNAAAGFAHFLNSGYGEGRTVTFDGLEYIASYSDLIHVFGANDDAGASHYIQAGRFEGRTTSFDGLEYIASYGDLINAFHTQVAADPNPDLGTTHYIVAGYAEHRVPDLFDAAQYLANYADLQAAFGSELEAATIHYITNGYFEGRTDHPL